MCARHVSPLRDDIHVALSILRWVVTYVLQHFSLNSSPILRRHGLFRGRFRRFRNWVVVRNWGVATRRSVWYPPNDLGRRNRVFPGHIQFSFGVVGHGVCCEGELEHSYGDPDDW